MITSLVSMYEKGAITADHLAAQCIHLIDPEDPGLVLSDLPNPILDRMRGLRSKISARSDGLNIRNLASHRPGRSGQELDR